MDGLTLVQLEQPIAVGLLDDAGVLVLRLDLLQHPAVARRLDRADRQRQQDRRGRRARASPRRLRHAEHRHHGAGKRKGEERAPRAEQRDQQQRRAEGADQAADRRDRVQAPGDGARSPRPLGRRGGSRTARRRRAASPGERRAPARPTSDPDEGARGHVVQRVDRHVEERIGDERDQADRRARRPARACRGPCRCGWRSAKRPPSQYPTESATSTTPIVFAHTIVDAPKNGAISRAAAISAPERRRPDHEHEQPEGREFARAPCARPYRRIARRALLPTCRGATHRGAVRDHDRSSSSLASVHADARAGRASRRRVIESGDGVWLIDTAGRRYIDGVSSLWCNVHGHRHPRIDAAVREQLDRVAHTTMLGLSHRPAERAGATGWSRWRRSRRPGRRGRAEPRLLLRQRLDGRRDRAQDGLPVLAAGRRRAAVAHDASSASRTPTTATRSARCRSAASTSSTPSTGRCCSTRSPVPAGDAAALADALAANEQTRSPRSWSSRWCRAPPGMLLQPPGYLRQVRELCDRHDVFLICDEVATGFGRTGTHVRLRARAGRARLPLPREGPHRRLPAAGRHAHHRARPRRLPGRARGVPDLLPRPHLHRQPAGLRGGARHARRLRARSARWSDWS